MKICSCGQCLNSLCIASDSNLRIKNCWCAECADTRKEIKKNKYKIIIINSNELIMEAK